MLASSTLATVIWLTQYMLKPTQRPILRLNIGMMAGAMVATGAMVVVTGAMVAFGPRLALRLKLMPNTAVGVDVVAPVGVAMEAMVVVMVAVGEAVAGMAAGPKKSD